MSWNLYAYYAYVRGNPIYFIDLTGMSLKSLKKFLKNTRIDKRLENNYTGAENEYYVIYYKDFLGVNRFWDSWGSFDEVCPNIPLEKNYFTDGHTHPNNDFFSGTDVVFLIYWSLK